jgi:L-fucose isomerase-like protein
MRVIAGDGDVFQVREPNARAAVAARIGNQIREGLGVCKARAKHKIIAQRFREGFCIYMYVVCCWGYEIEEGEQNFLMENPIPESSRLAA